MCSVTRERYFAVSMPFVWSDLFLTILPHPAHSKGHLLSKLLSKSSNRAVFWL